MIGWTGNDFSERLDELPEMFRLVIGMFYYEDCSYKEIAESLSPIGTVMSRLARGKVSCGVSCSSRRALRARAEPAHRAVAGMNWMEKPVYVPAFSIA